MSRLINVLILLFSVTVIVVVLVLIAFGLFKDPSSSIPMVTEPITKLNFQIRGYKVFDYNDVPFRFIIADAYILDNKTVSYSLSNLVTEENISLDNVEEYILHLNKMGYQFNDLTYNFVKSNENQVYVNIFIPVLDESLNVMRLNIWDPFYNDYNYYYFDLKQNVNTINRSEKTNIVEDLNLQPDSNSNIVSLNNDVIKSILFNNLKIFNQKDLFYINDQKNKLTFSNDNSKIYCLEMFHDYKQPIVIKSMKLVFDDGYSVFALPNQYQSTYNDNIIGKLWESGNGRVFFEINRKNDDYLNKNFSLYVLLKDIKQWVKLK